MENTFDDINWSSIGIDLSMEKTLENPMVEEKPVHHGPKVQAKSKPKTAHIDKGSLRKALYVCVALIVIGIVMVSFMAANAHAGMAFLRMEVVSISDDTITVRDEHGDVFDFWKENSPECTVGQHVVVATDMRYAGQDIWIMDRSRTSIIDTE